MLLVNNANYVFPTNCFAYIILIVAGGNDYPNGIVFRVLFDSHSKPYAYTHRSNVLSSICMKNGVK